MASLAAPLAMAACDETLGATRLDGPDASIDASPDTSSDAGDGGDARDADLGPCAPQRYDGGDAATADGAIDFCANLVRLPCGVPEGVEPRAQCFFALSDCDNFCPGAFFNCHAWDDSCVDGSIPTGVPITVDCVTCLGSPGRRPRGLEPASTSSQDDPSPHAGDLLADMAHLEAASVVSFRWLRRELAAFDAPRELVDAAAAAMRDETRHARVMQRFARRLGGKKMPRVRVRGRAPTGAAVTMETFARENAVEGCVNETYAALLAHWQATHASDPEVARAMARIAHDETEHAALSWAIARWIEPQLDDGARARIEAARTSAAQRLSAHGGLRVRHGDRELIGLPSVTMQRALAKSLMERALEPARHS